MWENRPREDPSEGPPHDQATFDEYLRFLHRSTRTQLRPPYNQDRIEDEPADATYSDHYDTITRHET